MKKIPYFWKLWIFIGVFIDDLDNEISQNNWSISMFGLIVNQQDFSLISYRVFIKNYRLAVNTILSRT